MTPDEARAEKIGYGAGAALIVGSFLPWATITAPFVGTVNKNGMEADGIVTLILGVIVAGVAFSWRDGGPKPIPVLVMGIAAAVAVLLVIVDFVDLAEWASDDEEFVSTSIGVGLYVCALGAAGAVAAAVLKSRATRPETPPLPRPERGAEPTGKVCAKGHDNPLEARRCITCGSRRLMKY